MIAAADIDLSIESGETLGVIGANGAGKTTFVNMVTGYVRPDSGSITYLGQDITGLSPRAITRQGICRSFQIPQLFPELSVLDNVLTALTISKRSNWLVWPPARNPEWIGAAEQILERFSLLEYGAQRAGTLAQGVRKLLDIAMATVSEPGLLLLDEPTSGISTEEKTGVMDTLFAALSRADTAVILVEHDMEIVERYALRVAAFYEGRIIAVGSCRDVLSNPEVCKHVVGTELHRKQPDKGRAIC